MRRLDVANIHSVGPEAVKQVNRTLVLNLIRQMQPISRSELAAVSGLHKSTMTDIVKELLADGLLLESGFKDSEGGRRAIHLRLNATNIRGVVIDLGVRQSAIMFGDVTGKLEHRVSFATPPEPGKFMARCLAELDAIFVTMPTSMFRGLTVSVPGLVDSRTGRLRLAPNLGWRDLELRAELTARYGLPVFVENEAKLSAVAEMWFGEAVTEAEASYAFISVTEGIGVGLVVENRLYCGIDGASGEFGHMTIQLDGPKCGCGKRGCWEAFASETAARQEYARSRGLDALAEADSVDFDRILAAAQKGDDKARAVLERMGRYLGVGIANIVNGLNLKLVIVGGRVTHAWDIVAPALQAEVQRHTLPSSASGLQVKRSLIGDTTVVGGLIQAFSPVFSGVTLS